MDNQWSLRCNPSRGNHHPTEAYLLAPLPSVMLWGLALLIDMESSPSLLRLIQFR